jgi:putative nucleotidyltransferase with HDIG domain
MPTERDHSRQARTDRETDMPARNAVPSFGPQQTAPRVIGSERPGEGHGRRLTAAFEALETFPALAESRSRLLRLAGAESIEVAELVGVIESDIALVVAVLRAANEMTTKRRVSIESIVDAVRVLSPESVGEVARRTPTFDFFERTAVWEGTPERVRLHGLATRAAADGLAAEIGYESRDRLMVIAVLHDIGKLVLMHAYAGYPAQVLGEARTPEERIRNERRELGVDHALVGGVLARRWGLPKSIASAVERHHADDATGDAALIRIADMLAHYAEDGAVSPAEMLRVGRGLGIGPRQLRTVMFNLPNQGTAMRRRAVEACPLSEREMDVLRHLTEGKVYKQIAHELQLSTSTVRTHLHNVYRKLGVVDRAQAVLTATEKGWI